MGRGSEGGSTNRWFARQGLTSLMHRAPGTLVQRLASEDGVCLLEDLWDDACEATGVSLTEHSAPPNVIARAKGRGVQVAVLALPGADTPGDARFAAVVSSGGRVTIYAYERCLDASMRLADDEAALVCFDGSGRLPKGAFKGLSLEAFMQALTLQLGVPELKVTAPDGSALAGSDPGLHTVGLWVTALLVLAAITPPLLFGLGVLGVPMEIPGWVRALPIAVATVALLAWLYQAFRALRGRTRHSASMAVTGWLVPIANLWIPALVLRDAWRATVGRGGAVVWAWMVVWWVAVGVSALSGLGLHVTPEQHGARAWVLDTPVLTLPVSADAATIAFSALVAITNLFAFALLAHIVHSIAGAPRPATR